MKTRTLLLLALGCGLAIMAAGVALTIQLATQDDPEPALAIGDVAAVAEMDVRVLSADEVASTLTVSIEIGGSPDDDPASGFRLIAGGRPAALVDSTCAATDGTSQSCAISFDVGEVDGTSRQLVYERGESQARWRLA